MIETLPCVSIWQPWASLLFDAGKVHELRTWPAPPQLLGQRIGIHAASRHVPFDHLPAPLLDLVRRTYADREWTDDPLPYRALLGTVRLERCWQVPFAEPASEADRAAGDWTAGRWAWKFAEPKAFAVPVPMPGGLGVWRLHADRVPPSESW